jgi:hypothetical protein
MSTKTIYMPLLDEGTTVWVPVTAEELPDGRFRVLGPEPDDQDWACKPDEIVAVKRVIFQDGAEGCAVNWSLSPRPDD